MAAVVRRHRPALELLTEGLERRARVTNQREAAQLVASGAATLMLMKRTSPSWNAVFEAVVKSL